MPFTKTAKTIAASLMLSLTTPAYTTTPEPTETPTQTVAEPVKLKATITRAPSVSNKDLECLIKVMNHEAGGEGAAGQKAVGYVVMNRVKSGRFPSSVCGVIYQRSQFTNITRAKAIPANKYSRLKTLASSIMSSYSRANDPTNGSLFFHATHVSPGWKNLTRTVKIGRHVFYKHR